MHHPQYQQESELYSPSRARAQQQLKLKFQYKRTKKSKLYRKISTHIRVRYRNFDKGIRIESEFIWLVQRLFCFHQLHHQEESSLSSQAETFGPPSFKKYLLTPLILFQQIWSRRLDEIKISTCNQLIYNNNNID